MEKRKLIGLGALVGAIIGLVLTIVAIFIESIPSDFVDFILSASVFVMLPSILLGAFIGFLSGLFKNKFISIGGILGSIIGFFHLFVIYSLPKSTGEAILIIFKPIWSLIVDSGISIGLGGFPLFAIYIILSTFIYGAIGVLAGFIISKIKGGNKSDK